MDEFEPWSMFSSTFMADESNNPLLEQDSLQSTSNLMYDIPSPVQNMQVKEEPVDPVPDNINDSNSNGPDVSRTSEANSQCDDNTLFDFGLDTTNLNSNHETRTKALTTDKALTPEDKYYQGLIKFEDAIVYICPACGKEFKIQENWKRHLNIVHNFNTRRGLNFVQLDKLYHKCLECSKRIAMHSMENLLKHKFTHLPYRCSKCSICKRQYKYRQDLMVHIRMMHRNQMLAIVKAEHQNKSKPVLAIGDVKENAFDIFDKSNDNIEVKNELIDPDDLDEPPLKKLALDNASVLASFLDDASSNGSGEQSLGFPGILSNGPDGNRNGDSSNTDNDNNECDDSLEEFILFLCPQCGTECETQAQWRQHIEFVHDFGSLKALNFTELPLKQAQCMECNQVITPNDLRRLQYHNFTHLSHKDWLTCKLCFVSFSSSKDIEKHLAEKHYLKPTIKETNNTKHNIALNEDDSQDDFGLCGDDYDNGAGAADTKNLLSDTADSGPSKSIDRDAFEQHICYLCPQCGREYNDKKQWRKHIVDIHQLGDLETMNYEVLNDRQLRCRECDKVITNAYGIQNAQQHRITHMKFKSFARCRLCLKAYTDRKGLIKHLRSSHRVGIRGMPLRMLSPPSSRPSFYSNMAMKSYKSSSAKEVVRAADCVYEILYIDEDDDEILAKYDEEFGDNEDTVTPNNSVEKSRYRCADCGSMFPTQTALQTHTKNEHDFKETNCNNVASAATSNVNEEEQSNDNEDLLIPTGEVEIKTEPPTTIESNFIYLCPQCGEEFRTQMLWRRHINVEHSFDKREYLDFRTIDKFHYQCKICKDTVQSSKLKGLQDHKFRHCPYKLYLKCLLCSQSYNHKPNMLTHLRQRHNIVEISEYTQSNSNSSISRTNRDDDEYQQGTSSVKVLGRKINENHPNAGASGNRPPGLKTVEDVISFHNAVDHESITYYCPSCYKNFESHVYWRKHIVEEHNLNSREGLNFRQLDEHHYICLQCYKRVTVTHTKGAIGQLQSHKFRHLPYKSFRCTVCEGEFVRKQMFFKHLDKNTNKCAGPIAPEQSNDDFSNSASKHNNTDNTQELNAEYDEDVDLSSALLQRNGAIGGGSGASFNEPNNSNSGSSWPSRSNNNNSSGLQSLPTPSLNEASNCFTIFCPQCGIKFETTQTWREHINIEHNLNNRTVLNFKRINPKLHQCLECKEHVNGRKLRDLQVHKFKHLPYGAYIHCRFCSMAYYHTSNMQEHLKNKHPQMLQKAMESRRGGIHEDEDKFFDGEDEADESSCGGNGGIGTGSGGGEVGGTFYSDDIDPDLLEVEAEIEEVDPDAAESEEQYLLG